MIWFSCLVIIHFFAGVLCEWTVIRKWNICAREFPYDKFFLRFALQVAVKVICKLNLFMLLYWSKQATFDSQDIGINLSSLQVNQEGCSKGGSQPERKRSNKLKIRRVVTVSTEKLNGERFFAVEKEISITYSKVYGHKCLRRNSDSASARVWINTNTRLSSQDFRLVRQNKRSLKDYPFDLHWTYEVIRDDIQGIAYGSLCVINLIGQLEITAEPDCRPEIDGTQGRHRKQIELGRRWKNYKNLLGMKKSSYTLGLDLRFQTLRCKVSNELNKDNIWLNSTWGKVVFICELQ